MPVLEWKETASKLKIQIRYQIKQRDRMVEVVGHQKASHRILQAGLLVDGLEVRQVPRLPPRLADGLSRPPMDFSRAENAIGFAVLAAGLTLALWAAARFILWRFFHRPPSQGPMLSAASATHLDTDRPCRPRSVSKFQKELNTLGQANRRKLPSS